MTLKRRIATVLRGFPLLTEVLVRLYRITRPRFTIGVVGVILNERDEVLLVEHVYHAKYPWGMPGGWLDAGEHPEDGVRRECQEELGITVEVVDAVYIERVYYPRHLDMAFLCIPVDEVSALSGELLNYRWVPIRALPELAPFQLAAIRAAVTRKAIDERHGARELTSEEA